MSSRANYQFLIVFFIMTATCTSFAQAIHGVFKVVKGDIRVVQSSDTKEVKAKIGQKVYPKDVIIAGADSRAKIVMVDNNEINVSPDSKVEIQNYEYKPEADKKNVLLNIMYGKVRAKVNQKYEGDNKFQVKTPSAVAGVRGTDFFTSYSPSSNATKVVTFHGQVAVGQPGPGGQILNAVFVSKGQTTSAANGAPPSQPTEVPKNELAQMDSQSDSAPSDSKNGSDRQPSDNGEKKDDKKDDKKDEPKKDDAKNNEPKKDEPKKDDAKNNEPKKPDSSKGGVSANAPVSGGVPGEAPKEGSPDGGRAPSSVSGNTPPPPPMPTGTMLRNDDLAGAKTPTVPIVMPVINTPPPPPMQNIPPKNDFINEAINGTNKKLSIKVTPGP